MVALAEIAASPTPRLPAPSSVVPALATLVAEREAGNGGGFFQRDPTCSGKQGGVRIGSYVDEVVAYRQVAGGVVGTYYPHYNHLYSVAALTNASGAVVERYTYDAYGKQTVTSPTGVARGKSAVGFDRGFTGYVADNETGLLHARARQYSPTLGRFVSRDPWQKRSVGETLQNGNMAYSPTDFEVKAEGLLERYKDAPIAIRAAAYMDLVRRTPLVGLGSMGVYFTPLSGDGYHDGYDLYMAYMIPGGLDPTGMTTYNIGCQWNASGPGRIGCRHCFLAMYNAGCKVRHPTDPICEGECKTAASKGEVECMKVSPSLWPGTSLIIMQYTCCP